MYPSTFKEDMPCGRGFEWVYQDEQLVKTLMTKEKISLESIQWIGYMENDPRFIDSKGNRCRIISGWNADEIRVTSSEISNSTYFIDGFCEVDGKKYALEYNGCRYHICDKCDTEFIGIDKYEGKVCI